MIRSRRDAGLTLNLGGMDYPLAHDQQIVKLENVMIIQFVLSLLFGLILTVPSAYAHHAWAAVFDGMVAHSYTIKAD